MATCPSCAHENRDAAKYCEECATPLGARGDRAERKVVTALFCDLVGSTSLGERYDPEVLRPALRAHFDEARAAVERVRAVAPDAPVPIECRIGVNTGEVLDPEVRTGTHR